MKAIPREVGGAKVVLYTPIDQRHRHTGNCRQIVAGVLMGAAAGLAICKAEAEGRYVKQVKAKVTPKKKK